jgi:hypothetical protein
MENSQPTIMLRGGPKDGALLVISDALNKRGYIKVPTIEMPAWTNDTESITSLMKVGMYRREVKHAGEPFTTEYREWHEWHWKGYM